MSSYTVIKANLGQLNKLYSKHMWCILGGKYEHNQEDNTGYVTLYTLTGKTIAYQMRKGVCFVEFMGFGNIRYDVAYEKDMPPKMYEKLNRWGEKLIKSFWRGGAI